MIENTQPAPDGTLHVGKAACIELWTGIATNSDIYFETESIIARDDRGEIRWRLRWGPEHGNSVRGVNLMRVRDGQVVEALGYVKGASHSQRRRSPFRSDFGRPSWPIAETQLSALKENMMIIIAGYNILAEADERDAAVKAFAGMVERARRLDGCIDFSMSADSVDPGRTNLFECWRDEQSWKAWRKVAKGPRVKIGESFVKLYRSDKAEKPF